MPALAHVDHSTPLHFSAMDLTQTPLWNDSTAPSSGSLSRAAYLIPFPEMFWILAVYPPVVVLLGTFGNIASLAVLQRLSSKSEDSALNVYLCVLAVCDLAQLYLGSMMFWIKTVFVQNLATLHTVVCKVSLYADAVPGVLSVWLLATITVQRAVSVLWPHHVNLVCTRDRSLTVVVALTVFVSLWHTPLLIVNEIVEHPEYGVTCIVHPKFKQYMQSVWPFMNVVVQSLLPTSIIILSNCVLLRQLMRSVRHNQSSLSRDQVRQRERDVSSITSTLVALSAAFCCLNCPLYIYITGTWWDWFDPSVDVIMEAVTVQMWYTGAAANFYLYCLTGTRFRTEFKAMVKEKWYWGVSWKGRRSAGMTRQSLDP